MKLFKLTGVAAVVVVVAFMLQVTAAAYADRASHSKYSHHGNTKYIDDDARRSHAYQPYRSRRTPTPHPRYRPGIPPGHTSPPGLRKGHDRDHRNYRSHRDRHNQRYYRDHRWRHPPTRRYRSNDDWDVTIHRDRHGTDVDIRYRKWW